MNDIVCSILVDIPFAKSFFLFVLFTADPPQLALSVWDEGFLTDHQQQEHCSQEWSSSQDQEDQEPQQTEKSQENPPCSLEQEPLEEEDDLEEDNNISFIFTNTYVKNELERLESSYQSTPFVRLLTQKWTQVGHW